MARLPVPEIAYDEYSNRQLLAVPLGFLVVALLVIGATFALTGAPVHLGIDFTGGVEMTVETDANQDAIASTFSREPETIQPVGGYDDRYILTFPVDVDEDERLGGQLESEASAAGFDVRSLDERSASFGSDTQREALFGILLAFLGMSVLIGVIFRTLVPSLAVVASAFSDLLIPLALMNLFGIELSLGTVAALLMLIGYSVDSDILLNNQVLRRRGDFYESTQRAMRTGVTMTITSIVAMIVMTLVAWFFQIPLLPAVGVVLVFGLTADLMNTYLMNVSLLRYYKYEAVGQ